MAQLIHRVIYVVGVYTIATKALQEVDKYCARRRKEA